MIFARCDRCSEEIGNMGRIYNIDLTVREIPAPMATSENLYGRLGAVKREHRRMICERCFDHYAKELQAEDIA